MEKFNINTQRLIQSSVIPLSLIYQSERMSQKKPLDGIWSSETMYGRKKSLDEKVYSQFFSNGTFFAEKYTMAREIDNVIALKIFIKELGFLEYLTIDDSKENISPGTEFMKIFRRNNIQVTRTEPEQTNQNPTEGETH